MSQITQMTNDQLTVSEVEELAQHEAIIERGLKTFVHVGLALTFIRDRRLYRATHRTFAAYCRQRWDIGRSRGYQLIDAAKTFENVHNCGQADGTKVMPKNEGQTRELSKLPDEEQGAAWREAVDRSGGQPTIAEVGEVVEERLGASVEDAPKHRPLVQHLTGTDEWYTPKIYLDAAREVLGGIDLDPASSEGANENVQAARFYTSDGITGETTLKRLWGAHSLWLNPPYSNTKDWVGKWCASVEATGMAKAHQAILLVNANTDTQWFQLLWDYWLFFTDHRIRFERPDGSTGDAPPKGSVFAYAGPHPQKFAKIFSQFGAIVKPAWNSSDENQGGIIP